MSFIADLHIHSKYSRATSKDMDIPSLARWAKLKGVAMLGTGDFTHPQWRSELKKILTDIGDGVYQYDGVRFILTAEVSNIYFKAGRTRKVHNILCAPSFEVAEEISRALAAHGDLAVDGRPIIDIGCDVLAKMLFAIDPSILIIPAHAWTPHFSIFGSNSGFDSPQECFEEYTPKIYAIETGLSSDPAMNWRWSALDRFCLTSHSDAHSPQKIGREANIFAGPITYTDLVTILRTKDRKRFLSTIEFFPEEGKYHWDGHRQCNARLAPKEAIRANNLCPICGKKVTVGVMHRVEGLADRPEGYVVPTSPTYKHIVPLAEILADLCNVGVDTKTVEREYMQLIRNLGSEFAILLELPEETINEACPPRIARGIIAMRRGNITITPGYDGEYGTVKVNVPADTGESKQLSFL